jgi:cell surface protein SprA
MYPDAEDLNRDNTMTESEEYFQYTLDIKPVNDPSMQIGVNFIVDKKTVNITGLPDGTTRPETWYQFRVPIASYSRKVGNIPDFKSIRFMRMYLTNWQDSVNLRFGKLELKTKVSPRLILRVSILYYQHRDFNVNGANIEENDKRSPPYRTPRDERQHYKPIMA